MRSRIKTKAIVLHEMPIKDNDKRLILLTKEAGKATAFARGARKPGSPFLAASQVMSYGEYELVEGKNAYTVTSGNLIHSFHSLREDMEQLALAMYFLEFADYVTQEGEADPEFMLLLLKALSALEKKRIPPRLVRRIFELKALTVIGLAPWVQDCSECHTLSDGMVFSCREGGLLCSVHSGMDASGIKIGEGALFALQFIQFTDPEKVFSFTLEDGGMMEIERVLDAFCDRMIGKKFKTLEFLKGLSI